MWCLFLYHFITPCNMGSLSAEDIADLRDRVRDLDASYAGLCAEEELGKNVENSKAVVLLEIQAISQLISDCEVASEMSRRQVAVSRRQVAVSHDDSPLLFLQEFLAAVFLMASSCIPQDFSNSVFHGTYLPVRGDGNCGLRAFLTALAARAGRHLSIDPLEMLDWVNRLKPLMIQEIIQMLSAGIIDESNLLSIPENLFEKKNTLNDYFALFLTDGYNITNFDFRVLASMFNLQINVIRQITNGYDNAQCFVRHGNEIDLIIAEHICILQQPGHFVPIIQIFESGSSGSINCLHSALAMGFTN